MPDLLTLLNIRPRALARSVFKYLAYEEGPNRLNGIKRKVLIACTARSGSSLVQSCLERYDLDAQEFFNAEGIVRQVSTDRGIKTIREYADFLADNALSSDGRFAVKGAFPALLFLYFLGEAPRLGTDWKIVFLRRKNVVRQAVSMRIAELTGQWTWDMPAQGTARLEDYSFDHIAEHLEAVFYENQIWERAFGLLELEPYRVFYEPFAADVDAETERIARFIGVDTTAFSHAREHVPRLKIQSTEINDAWERLFRTDILRRAVPEPPKLP